MNYKDKIIRSFTESACKKISGKVVRSLQKMTEGMQSGDDTPLKNVWDEICVQVQYEESGMWEIYLETISAFIEDEVKKLNNATKQAIWLQTEEGIDWEIDNEEGDLSEFYVDDIVRYILHEFVLSEATKWRNKRIEKYLERGYAEYFGA